MYSDGKGYGQNHPGQNLPDKRPCDKSTGTIERDFVQGAFVRFFFTRPTKNGGFRDVWCTYGRSRDVWQNVTEGENWSKIVWCTLWTAPREIEVEQRVGRMDWFTKCFTLDVCSMSYHFLALSSHTGHISPTHALSLPPWLLSFSLCSPTATMLVPK